ncbi:MAG: DUF3667 domain-containing protein [Flavobacteriaceae bacterium]
MGRKRRKRVVCSNCGQHLNHTMNYCFKCGQENHIKRVSVKMLLSDFSNTYFSFDSKLLVSLKHLLFKPSFLSTEYLNGRIETYLRPMRMYVFISFVFFLLNGLLTTNDTYDIVDFTKDGQSVDIELVQEDLKANPDLFEVDGKLLEGKFRKIFSDNKEIKLFVGVLMSKLPILFFLLIPVFGALLFIFFYKKSYFYVDHLVFVLHLQSFAFVLLTLHVIIESIVNYDALGIVCLVFLIYGFIAARRFYKLGKVATFFRLTLTGLFHVFFSVIIFLAFFFIVLRYYNV